MEFASGGELFEYLCHVQRFSENEARYFFQQLVAGVDYCHQKVIRSSVGWYFPKTFDLLGKFHLVIVLSTACVAHANLTGQDQPDTQCGFCCMQGVCHRDLKLENILLDGSPAPRLKICDFGYSKVRGR